MRVPVSNSTEHSPTSPSIQPDEGFFVVCAPHAPASRNIEVTLTHDRCADADTATRHTRGWTESLERLSVTSPH